PCRRSGECTTNARSAGVARTSQQTAINSSSRMICGWGASRPDGSALPANFAATSRRHWRDAEAFTGFPANGAPGTVMSFQPVEQIFSCRFGGAKPQPWSPRRGWTFRPKAFWKGTVFLRHAALPGLRYRAKNLSRTRTGERREVQADDSHAN